MNSEIFSTHLWIVLDTVIDCNSQNRQISLTIDFYLASLIRTIIGGAQIIDLMILVIDVVKGMQTQTAECMVIGEITCSHMMVVLNKVDLLSPDTRDSSVQKMTKKMKMTLSKTKFKDAPIVPVAAKIGGHEETGNSDSIGMIELIETLKKMTYLPNRDPNGDFVFAVDHCFSIKGQGTVMTGTVLSGSIQVNSVCIQLVVNQSCQNVCICFRMLKLHL